MKEVYLLFVFQENELDVLIIGLDSVSKLNFMRQLPKTYKLITRQLNAVVLIGFNKVGQNTFPNVVPMLTGRPLIPGPHEKFRVSKLFCNTFHIM